MRSNGVQRLEIVEIVLLIISLLSLLAGGITGNLIYSMVLILLTQILSLLNRFRFQQMTRRRISGLNKQITGQNLIKESSQVETVQKQEKLVDISGNSTENLSNQTRTKESSPAASLQWMTPPQYQTKYQLKAHQDTVSGLSISPDGRYLVSVSWDQTLKLWEISTGRLLKGIIAHSSGILAIVFLEKQEKVDLATGSFDQTLKVWKIEQNSQKGIEINLKTTLRDHTGSLQCLAYNSNSQILISGSYDQTIKQWKMPQGELLATGYDQNGSIYAIACAPLGQYIASAGGDGQVILWQIGTENQINTLVGNISSVQSLAISPDGKIVAAGCINGQIFLWQIEANQRGQIKPFRILKGHHGPIKALIFDASLEKTSFLFSGGSDGIIYLWHFDNTQPLAELKQLNDQETKPISSLILSSDGKYLVAGDISGKIQLWLRE